MIDREQLIDELFAKAVDLTPGDRERFFAKAKVGNGFLSHDGVLDEVRALLRNFQSAEDNGFLYRPLVAAEPLDGRSQTLTEGQDFEGYKVIKLIAEGGMGEVYLARDPELDRKVAIKLIKSHLKTKELLRRFRNERQILANLQHPNIARLFEAGANADGLPFFVMEYVEGKPIDQYASAQQLSLTDRLKLFRTACSAITCAHQNLVIHRDIKPSNILVTVEGEPKLLDFGIAKLLDESNKQEATLTMFHAMTPEYASPEQVKGEPITTASDVYALGVLLYELLTGRRPYKLKRRTTDEITKAICEQEPAKPSAAIANFGLRNAESKGQADSRTHSQSAIRNQKSLRGDLDNIVLKALRKEPQRRYASVEQFSEDIRRHLEGLPVIACKDTLSYRTSKFVQRNKIGVTAAAVILLTLIGGIVGIAWQAHKARVQSARAEQRFSEARALAHSVVFDYHDAIASLPGSTPVRERLVKDALKYLDELADDEDNGPSLQRELAAAYLKVGDVQSSLNRSNVGDTSGAFNSYRKSLAIREELFASDPGNLQSRLDLSVSYARMGDILSKSNNAPGALENYRKALQLIEDVAANNPKNNEVRRALGYCYLMVARAVMAIGDLPAALESFHKSKTIRETLSAENPEDESLRRDLVPSLDGVAYVLSLYGKPAEALDYYRKSQAISEALVAANPTNAEFRRVMMDSYEWVGITFGEIGDNTQGLEYHHKALALCQAQLIADPANAQARDDLGDVYYEIGNTLIRLGKSNEALNNFRKSLENYRAVSDVDPTNKNARRQVYITYREIGIALLSAGNISAALENYKKALEVFQELAQADPDNAETQYHLGITYRNIGEALAKTGDLKGTIESYRQAISVFETLVTRSPANAKTRTDLAFSYYDLGTARSKLAQAETARSNSADDWRQAREWYQKSLDIWQDLKSHGTLRSADASKPEELAKEIARCDAHVR